MSQSKVPRILVIDNDAIFSKDFELDQQSIEQLKNMEIDTGTKLNLYVAS